MKFDLYQEIVLKYDIPNENIKKGDVATIVEYISSNSGEGGYCLEVFNVLGDTIKVITVSESDIELMNENEVFSVRSLEAVK